MPNDESRLQITPKVQAILRVMLAAPRSGHYAGGIEEAANLKRGYAREPLRRLEAAGWLVSTWETPGESSAPPRRYYWFAPGGKASAKRVI